MPNALSPRCRMCGLLESEHHDFDPEPADKRFDVPLVFTEYNLDEPQDSPEGDDE